MPIYEFFCKKCDQKFEELCRPGTETIPCPFCGEKDTSRLISAFGFAVKSAGGSSSFRTSTSKSCSSCSGGSCSSCH